MQTPADGRVSDMGSTSKIYNKTVIEERSLVLSLIWRLKNPFFYLPLPAYVLRHEKKGAGNYQSGKMVGVLWYQHITRYCS